MPKGIYVKECLQCGSDIVVVEESSEEIGHLECSVCGVVEESLVESRYILINDSLCPAGN